MKVSDKRFEFLRSIECADSGELEWPEKLELCQGYEERLAAAKAEITKLKLAEELTGQCLLDAGKMLPDGRIDMSNARAATGSPEHAK